MWYSFANKKTNALDTCRFLHYQKHAFLPFVESLRVAYDGHIPDGAVLDELTVSSWGDGDFGQLAATTHEERIVEAALLKIISNNHAAASSATQQMADLLKLVNKLNKITSAEGRMTPLKQAIIR
jgi:hypothetical protein